MIVTVASPIVNLRTASYAAALIAIVSNIDKMIMRFIVGPVGPVGPFGPVSGPFGPFGPFTPNKKGGREAPLTRYIYIYNPFGKIT